jgi:hypothetical protein
MKHVVEPNFEETAKDDGNYGTFSRTMHEHVLQKIHSALCGLRSMNK